MASRSLGRRAWYNEHMAKLDPSHELTGAPQLPDLPPPRPSTPLGTPILGQEEIPPGHRPSWSWLVAGAIASLLTFVATAVAIAVGWTGTTVAVLAPLVFIFLLFFLHAAAERAR